MNPQLNMSDIRTQWALFLHNKQLGLAWVAAALLGALLISSSNAMDLKRFCAPVVVMIVYAIVVFNRGQDLFKSAAGSSSYQNALIAQLADSVYFLGFLWTLWALIDSFVLKTDAAASSVFRTFGYALVTTSCGMFMRLAILQFRYTAMDQSLEAEVSVEEKLQRFGVSLQSAEAILSRWNVVLTDSSVATTAMAKDLEKTLSSISTEIRSSMQTAVSEHRAMVSATVAQSCGAAQEVVRTATGAIVELTGNIGKPLKNELAEVADILKRSNTSLSKSLPKFSERIQVWGDSLQGADQSLTVLRTSSEATDTALDGLRSTIRDAASEFDRVKDIRQEVIRIFIHGSEDLRTAVAHSVKDGLKEANWQGVVVIQNDNQKLLDAINTASHEVKNSNEKVCEQLHQLLAATKTASGDAARRTEGEGVDLVRREILPLIKEIRDGLSHPKSTVEAQRPGFWPPWRK